MNDGEKKKAKAARQAEIRRLYDAGVKYREIARMLGCSEKTVQRTVRGSGQDRLPASVRRLKPRQQKLITGVAQGLTARQAALEAGYTENTASNAKRDLLEKPALKAAFADLMRAQIPDELVIQRLREGIDATETKFFAHNGNVKAERNVINYGERRAYLELRMRATGQLKEAVERETPVQLVIDI